MPMDLRKDALWARMAVAERGCLQPRGLAVITVGPCGCDRTATPSPAKRFSLSTVAILTRTPWPP